MQFDEMTSLLPVKLQRQEQVRATPFSEGEGNDRELLTAFLSPEWSQARQQQLEASWQFDFENPAAFLDSVENKRTLLRKFLGPLNLQPQFEILEQTNVSGGEAGQYDCRLLRLVLKAGIGNLSFSAYVVIPETRTSANTTGVIALHGHESSAEKLVGFGEEDYGRRLALRLGRKGYYVIAPNITSSLEKNNAISAHAALYGYTLPGIMAQFVFCSLEFLRARFPELKRFGLYGISNGAFIAWLVSALCSEIAFVVSSGMLSSVYDRRLKKRHGSDAHEYYFYFQGTFWMEFCMRYLAALSIPKLQVIEVGETDAIVRDWWREDYNFLQNLYTQLGIANQCHLVYHNGGHEIAENYGIDTLTAALKEDIRIPV